MTERFGRVGETATKLVLRYPEVLPEVRTFTFVVYEPSSPVPRRMGTHDVATALAATSLSVDDVLDELLRHRPVNQARRQLNVPAGQLTRTWMRSTLKGLTKREVLGLCSLFVDNGIHERLDAIRVRSDLQRFPRKDFVLVDVFLYHDDFPEVLGIIFLCRLQIRTFWVGFVEVGQIDRVFGRIDGLVVLVVGDHFVGVPVILQFVMQKGDGATEPQEAENQHHGVDIEGYLLLQFFFLPCFAVFSFHWC